MDKKCRQLLHHFCAHSLGAVSYTHLFLALIDAVYKVESLTARLDTLTRDVPFSGANEVKVMKLSTVGLGTYSRAAGYPAGDITATWETMQLTAERGRAFSLDRMDNELSLIHI